MYSNNILKECLVLLLFLTIFNTYSFFNLRKETQSLKEVTLDRALTEIVHSNELDDIILTNSINYLMYIRCFGVNNLNEVNTLLKEYTVNLSNIYVTAISGNKDN